MKYKATLDERYLELGAMLAKARRLMKTAKGRAELAQKIQENW